LLFSFKFDIIAECHIKKGDFMAEIEVRVYQISVYDLERLIEKFPVFASAKLSSLAKKLGAYENKDTETGWYFTRNKAENGWVIYVGFNGGLISYSPSNKDTGLRVGMHIEYDENSDVVKSVRDVKRKAIIWDRKTKSKKKLFGKAPVVTFGKIDYIWMNKEDCDAGLSKTMDLISLELITKAVQFNDAEWNNNYNEAVRLRNQSEFVALFNCTAEERKMVVPVKMSSSDNFMKITLPEKYRQNEERQKAI